jgi:hypothetical protein
MVTKDIVNKEIISILEQENIIVEIVPRLEYKSHIIKHPEKDK